MKNLEVRYLERLAELYPTIAAASTEVINLEGKTMLPAFIDPHSHFTSVASLLDKVDLSGCPSMEEIRTRLKELRKARNLADDAFLVGTGYDHNDLPG